MRLGAWTTDFFTVAKLIPIALIALAGLHALPAWRPEAPPEGWRPLGAACFLAYFAYQGFETVPVPAGEARDPKRDVPFAVLAALGGSAVLYILVQVAALSLVPGLAVSERPLADAAAALMVAGLARDWKEGLAMAADSIDSGRAAASLAILRRLTVDG